MKINNLFLCLCALLMGVACTKKIPARAWVPAQEGSVTTKVDLIVVVNGNKGDLLYDRLEASFRESLSRTPFIKVKEGRKTEELMEQLKEYNLMPTIPKKRRIAFLTFQADEKHNIMRVQNTRDVTLQSCDYLRKKDQCWDAGKATLREGLQKVSYVQKVTIHLKDEMGTKITPTRTITHRYKDEDLTVPDPLILQKKVSDLIASGYARQILPYQEYFDLILLGGDSISVTMIEKGAYSLALKRLEKIISNGGKTSENIFLQGVVFELTDDMSAALDFYHQASVLDANNKEIKAAIKRIERVMKVVAK